MKRRSVNPQTAEYVANNDLICFGVSEHILEENMPSWTDQAVKDLNVVNNWFPRR
jgi:hypothetical protein